MIQYHILPADPKGHLFTVQCLVAHPDAEGQIFSLPNWIPGSYLIRDFAKNIVSMVAHNQNGQPVAIRPISTNRWQADSVQGSLKVTYQVYAWDLSVRGAHFDQTHAFFNGTSVFLAVEGQKDQAIQLHIQRADWMPQDWCVATTLEAETTDDNGFGQYHCPDYTTLIDEPVEISDHTLIEFEASGIPHQMVLSGQNDADPTRLAQDLKKICETEHKIWGAPLPIKRYLFIVLVTEKGYGGLEHKNNTVLMCTRNDLPYAGMQTPTDDYLNFLELCAHEYFHLWNVKRIQPLVYQQTDLESKAYTEQLWWFEGVTSYFDGYILRLANLISEKQYLNLLSKQMTRVYRMPGRFKQSVAESSFLTWTTFYQQNENAPNAIISYYTKGSLIALALDLMIRQQSYGQKSLIDVLRHLWQHYGVTEKGLKEKEIEQKIVEVTGLKLENFFERYLYGTEDLPIPQLLLNEGVEMTLRPPANHKDLGGQVASSLEDDQAPVHLGANLTQTEHQTLKITHVWQGSIAYEAGLSAGDELIAINQLRMDSQATLEATLIRHQHGDTLTCHYFRDGILYQTTLTLKPHSADHVVLQKIEPEIPSEWLAGKIK